MKEFKGKKILITGSSKGIGKACALRFAQDGADIIINHRNSEAEALEVLKEVKERGGTGEILKADMGDESAIRELWEKSIEGSPPSVLVLNAAFQKKGPFDEVDVSIMKKTLEVNVVGNFLLAKLFIDHCKRHKIPGVIVIHGSNQGEFVNPTGFAYGISKAALHHMVRHLAGAVVKNNIRVNGIILGWFNTEGERTFYSADQIESQASQSIPLKRAGKPEEAAEMAYYLSSEKSAYMTGSLVRIDGGFALDPDLST